MESADVEVGPIAAAFPRAGGQSRQPRVVLVIPRGEAVRNFLHSDTLPALAREAAVTVLSVVDDETLLDGVRQHADEIVPLREYPPAPWVSRLRVLTENAHDRWLWSEVAKNNWELRDRRAASQGKRLQRLFVKASTRAFSWRAALRLLTRIEQKFTLMTASTREFETLFERVRPAVVFNGSHIHGASGELPLRVASSMGIPTAGFIFSWDNLTSRSRIFVPYDHWLVWHDGMKRQLLGIYPEIPPERVHVTGTPQFDYHFRSENDLGREELCRQIGIDPGRPYILYTAGIAHHFFEEHRHVELIISLLEKLHLSPKPQLVVRTNIKDTSPEMERLASEKHADVRFPRPSWDAASLTPKQDDLAFYSSLLRHCALGINAASTVSLELLMFDKPVINLDFDPPGSSLPWCLGYQRHIRFDHYWPVATSGAVMVARSPEDMERMIVRGLTRPAEDATRREEFVSRTFGGLLDGQSGARVARALLKIASTR